MIATVRPAIAPGAGAVQPNRRARTAGPMRLKLPTTEISSASSTTPSPTCDGPLTGSPDRPVLFASNIRQSLYKRSSHHDHPSASGSRPPCPLDDAFAFVADFANAERWDPGVASSVRLEPGPGRRRRALPPRHPHGRAGRPDGLRGHGLRSADACVVLRGHGQRRRGDRRDPVQPRTTTARASTTRPTSGSSAGCGCWPRSPAARSRASAATRATACSGRSTVARSGPDEPWTSRSSAPGSAACRPPTRSARITG